MAKIIVTKGDTVLQEMDLSKERITIGRRSYNDIVINDLAISGEHAVIVTEKGDSFLEDLNSTNGTQINGQPVRKHFLRDGDVIELAQYRISYIAQLEGDRESNAVFQDSSLSTCIDGNRPLAFVKVMNGPNAGSINYLKRPLTTIGRQGTQVAAIVWKAGNYHIAHVEGDSYPFVNGYPIGPSEHLISSGDSINLSGVLMEFSLLLDQ